MNTSVSKDRAVHDCKSIRQRVKTGSGTHSVSVLHQRRSQIQKYNPAQISDRIAVDQKERGWDGGQG